MSNKKRKPQAKRQPSSYRAPAAAPEPRRGLLDGILAPRAPGGSPMPKLRTTLARGSVTALGIPPLLVAIPIVVLVTWIGLVLVGYEGPFKLMSFVFAIPPITSVVDNQIVLAAFRPPLDATGLSGGAPVLLGTFGAIVFHAVITAVVTTCAVEHLRTGSVTTWALRRSVPVLRVTAVTGVIALGLYFTGRILLVALGSIGLFLFVGALAAGVYALGFAPVIAADEERTLASTLTRSVRVARMPGSANLWIAVIYVLVSAVVVLAPLPGSGIGVTPSVAAWVVVLVVNVLHVLVLCSLAYRYLVVAPAVGEGPPERRRR